MKENSLKFRKIFEILFTVYTVLLGVMFIWHTVDIYLDGISNQNVNNDIYSRSIVSQHLSQILIFAIIWILMIIAGFVLFKMFPYKKEALIYKEPSYQLKRLKKRSNENIDQLDFVAKQNKVIFYLKITGIVLWSITIIWSIIYLANPKNFPKIDVTKEILKMILNIFPLVIISLGFSCFVSFKESFSANSILSQIKNQEIKFTNKEKTLTAKKNKVVLITRIAIAIIAIVFIVLGAFNGTMRDVLIKAINICTECIGLG